MAGAAALISSNAFAATATTTFNVQLILQAACTVSATNLDFGTQGVLTASVDVTSTVNVQCTNSTNYTVGLDKGLNGADVANRKMKGSGAATVNYSMYKDAGRTTNWGDTAGTGWASGTGNGAVQPLTVYGRVPAQTTPAPDTYNDTITVTVTY